MAMTTLSSREFNQDTGRAKNAAKEGPVIITDRGRPAHVLLTYEQYQQLAGTSDSIIDLLSAPANVAEIELETPRFDDVAQAADLS